MTLVPALAASTKPDYASEPRAAIQYSTARIATQTAGAKDLGSLESNQEVNIALTLPHQNEAQLKTLLKDLYDPKSPKFHHWLAKKQFAQQFGGNPTDFQAAVDFATSQGLTVKLASPSRTYLVVSGPAATVAKAFGTSFKKYALADGRTAYAATSTPTLPASIGKVVSGAIGFDNVAVMRPSLSPTHVLDSLSRPIMAQPRATGYGGTYSPSDLHTAYNIPNTIKGDNQTAAIYELGGYNQSDILQFTQQYGLPNANLVNVYVNGADGSENGYEDEVCLDIDSILSIAPNLQTMYVYEGTSDQAGVDATFQQIADDDVASVVSVSYGWPETAPFGSITAEAAAFEQMSSQGQSVFVSSGDSGAYTDDKFNGDQALSVSDPASQPQVTAVGGTSLYTNSAGDYVSEVVWQGTFDAAPDNGGGSGGGYSSFQPVPAYQSAVFGSSVTMRALPDVALDADPNTGIAIFCDGYWEGEGGTSMSSPLWAGYMVLVNQRRSDLGLGPIGEVNPAIYPIAASSLYASTFHDITSGNNLFYTAGPGYDLASGWGSFNGVPLLNVLAPAPVLNSISPSEETAQSGGLTVTIDGVNLATDDAVMFGNTQLLPDAGSNSTQLIVDVPAGALSTPGSIPVSVQTPGGVTSNTIYFTVDPLPAITSLSPSGATVGHPSDILVTLNGSFANGDHVTVDGQTVVPSQFSTTQITVTIPASELQTVGSIPITVTSFDNFTSQPAYFTVSPAPTLSSISPTTVQAGHAPFLLTATGTNFVAGDQIVFGSDTLAATAVSGTTLTATIPAKDIVPGTVQVSVETPDSIQTAQKPFTITAAPSITSVTPTSATIGASQLALVVSGSGFSPTDQVVWASTPLATTYVSATELEAVVPAAQLTAAGSYPVKVVTAAQGASNAVNITLNNPAPVISSLTPGSIASGQSAAATLTVNGSNFIAGSVVEWNGTPLSTTFVSSSKLTAIVPVTDLSSAGKANVVVVNPAPGGGTSTPAVFTITGVTTVYGLVTRSLDSATVSSGTVVLTDSTGAQYQVNILAQTATGPDGKPYNYTLTSMPGGTFTGVASSPGYTASKSVSISVPATGSLRQDFTLSAYHTYSKGLSMVSAPNDFSGSSIDTVLPDLDQAQTGSEFIAWNPESYSYAISPNSPADALRPGQGYWAYLKTTVHLVGPMAVIDPTKPYAISLIHGWNMIGDPFPFAVSVAGLQSGSASSPSPASSLIFSGIYTYDADTQAYTTLAGSDTLQPFVGYWVYALKTGTLLVNPTGK